MQQQQRHRDGFPLSNDLHEQLIDAECLVQDSWFVLDPFDVDFGVANVSKCRYDVSAYPAKEEDD